MPEETTDTNGEQQRALVLIRQDLERLADQNHDVYGSLRLKKVGAYLLVHCHNPDIKIGIQDMVWSPEVDFATQFYSLYLPYDPKTKTVLPFDPLDILYRAAKQYFGTRQSAESFLTQNPLQENEQRCIEELLKDSRFPYSLKEMLHKVVADYLSHIKGELQGCGRQKLLGEGIE